VDFRICCLKSDSGCYKRLVYPKFSDVHLTDISLPGSEVEVRHSLVNEESEERRTDKFDGSQSQN